MFHTMFHTMHHHHHHHPEGGPHGQGHGPHPHRGFGGMGRSGRSGGPGGGRVRRGEARYVLLDALRSGPKHGYEIIKALEERSEGQYAASPGTVYPTLQYLEEIGMVRSDQSAGRRVFELTDAGRADVEAHAEEVSAFWAQFATPPVSAAAQTEIGFLQEEMQHLRQTIWNGLHGTASGDDADKIRRIRQRIEQCQTAVRQILVETKDGVETPL